MAGINQQESSRFAKELAKSWPGFVNCEKRLVTEAPFLRRVLSHYKDGIVFDAALGTGCDTIFLIQQGFTVISNEINPSLLEIAIGSALRHGVTMNVNSFDWRSIGNRMSENSVDAIILLGNSLCLVRKLEQIEMCLQQFYSLLKPGGCILVDERNFDYIANSREEILAGNYRYSRRFIYCGSEVTGRPTQIEPPRVQFGYFRKDGTLIGTLEMYSFKAGELAQLLTRAGFKDIKLYSDLEDCEDNRADFFTYAAFK